MVDEVSRDLVKAQTPSKIEIQKNMQEWIYTDAGLLFEYHKKDKVLNFKKMCIVTSCKKKYKFVYLAAITGLLLKITSISLKRCISSEVFSVSY